MSERPRNQRHLHHFGQDPGRIGRMLEPIVLADAPAWPPLLGMNDPAVLLSQLS